VAASTALLTVYRNGAVLFSVADASHFIANGRPGIGLFAGAAVALDSWVGGKASPGPQLPRDDFDRPNGDLGPNWVRDPAFGAGTVIAGGQVGSTPLDGGAHYWNGNVLGASQYSQITLTGAIGDWTGVVVRGGAAPSQGYWVAVKADGAYLYSYVGGIFYELAHDPTAWSTGDVLKLEVWNVATSTARLTVSRNGTVLLVVDDGAHFIAGGQPGIGLYASAAVALDSWEGGTVNPGPPLPRDDFDRADGDLGPNWVDDASWGTGTAITSGQVTASPFGSGAHYWNGSVLGADQYSRVTLTGAIGDWAGVVVRGNAAPSQGYWAVIKPDGSYLYSYVGGVFHLLAHDATVWATGDALRLEVVTVAASTARLTVSRNGEALVTVDDAAHFIASGQPGIGLYASTSVALDGWEGGDAPASP
jgi:hypothetical protein